METVQVLQYFEGKTILITGATGFLAKILVEKILRVQPNVKKLFLLMRPTAKRNVEQRLHDEVVGTDLFRVLREGYGEDFKCMVSSKVIPISGDVACENLGIVDEELREEMWREIDIIVNSAATTDFDGRYDLSFAINVLGAMHVQDFGTKCSKLEILLHVSSAFVHGNRVGVLKEKPFAMGETIDGAKIPYLDVNSEKNIIEEKLRLLQTQMLSEKEITRAMKELGIQRAMLHGWSNTYVFTKAMGEMLLGKFKQNCNVIIIRPTIITSTIRDPFPGWIEGLRTLDSVFVGLGKGKVKLFVGDPMSHLDMIPGDMVVNCMLTAIASHSIDKHDLIIYQIGSSTWNPMKLKELWRLMLSYLTKNPFLDSRGKPIKIGKPTTVNTMADYRKYIKYRYLPFLKILKLGNMILCCNNYETSYTNTKRRIDHATRLVELYKPFLFWRGSFDDGNTENMRMRMRGSNNIDVDVLNFHPNCIKWDDYLRNTHFPGFVKYVLK